MPKNKQSTKKITQPSKSRDFTFSIIPGKYQTPVFLVIILLLIIIFFNAGLFGGKVFSSADNIASASFNTYLEDARKQDIFPLWVPYIFCGMPSFAALIPHLERMYDISHAVWVTIRDIIYSLGGNNPVWSIVLFYIIFSFSFYFLAEYKFGNKVIALFCALAAVFITPVVQFIIVGHNSKMIAVMMFPLILLFIEKIFDHFQGEKKNPYRLMLYFAALVFFIHLQMSSNHIQMLFYFYFAIGIYLAYRLIHAVMKKVHVSAALRTIALFILAAGLSAMMYADSYLSIREYNKYSIRGVPAVSTQLTGEQKEPLDYEYATNWSFSPAEVMTLFIPYWVGFGDVEYKGQRTNTYWGQMPFTTSPVYFGVITMLLGFIGIYYNFRKNVLVQAFTIISFIALLLSFGRTFPVLFDLMFYNFPYFSSFRAPVMAHILINVSFVILAGFGIKSVIEVAKDKASSAKFTANAKYIFPILLLPVIFSFIGFEGYYTSLVSSGPLAQKLQMQGANPQQVGQYVGQIAAIAYSNVKSEMLIIGVILTICYWMCYMLAKGKVSFQVFSASLLILLVFDLWHIDFKTLHWDSKSESEKVFKAPDYAEWLQKNDPPSAGNEYRVLELNQGQPVRGNTLAYWRIQSLYGYQGAKVRIFQDMDDIAGLTNPVVWNITNTKYIISDQLYSDTIFTPVFKGSKNVLLNRNYLPRAFFVSSFKVAGGLEILNSIRSGDFDPGETAYLEKDPGAGIDPAGSTAKVQVTSYGIHEITLDAEASGNNLLFLSEVYYPAGWNAFIDGQETEIYKTNYVFRSIIVPEGKHKIEFRFEPDAYYTGKKVSVGANIVLIAIFGAAVTGILIKRKKQPAEPEKMA